jgi:hypothetical protein
LRIWTTSFICDYAIGLVQVISGVCRADETRPTRPRMRALQMNGLATTRTAEAFQTVQTLFAATGRYQQYRRGESKLCVLELLASSLSIWRNLSRDGLSFPERVHVKGLASRVVASRELAISEVLISRHTRSIFKQERTRYGYES